ncbi:MAG: carboxypeptidase-like regulatory domain-containing protein, partial [Acidobacteriota bacterium]
MNRNALNKRSTIAPLLVFLASLVLPATARAQEATVSGIVSDITGGVLPGVTITAVHEATGNTFFATTDGTGSYRLPVRI